MEPNRYEIIKNVNNHKKTKNKKLSRQMDKRETNSNHDMEKRKFEIIHFLKNI